MNSEIARNIAVHNHIARGYNRRHTEIFNPIEQQRLRRQLSDCYHLSLDSTDSPSALDFGCGSGNLTDHLLSIGYRVTSADISSKFLSNIQRKHPGKRLVTHLLNGKDLSSFDDGTFDLVATYSVLHHIPDYLTAVKEMIRVTKPGGLLLIDHETSEFFWKNYSQVLQFRKNASRFNYRKYLYPANYYHAFLRIFDKKHANEGDIHVWPDDHVSWPLIKELAFSSSLSVVSESDYLLFNSLYRHSIYAKHVGIVNDTKCLVLSKP